MNNTIEQFKRHLRIKWWRSLWRQGCFAPDNDSISKYRREALIEYLSASDVTRRTAAMQSMEIARAEVFQFHNFVRGITEASFSIDLFSSIPSLYTRARINLYAGKWQAALDDLTSASKQDGPVIWRQKARSLELWVLLVYCRDIDIVLDQPDPGDFIAQATFCRKLFLDQEWIELNSALGSIACHDDQYVIAVWLRDLEISLYHQLLPFTEMQKVPPTVHRMLRMVELVQVEAALAECSKLIEVAPNKRRQLRLERWQGFLLTSANAIKCNQEN